MTTEETTLEKEPELDSDNNKYALTSENSDSAVEKGLAEADWYLPPVSRKDIRKLLERKNGPAIRDTLLWFALIFGSGYAAFVFWGTWWVIIPFACYGVLYASSSDARWHESGHGTAFKSDWMNHVLYEISSFMLMREPTLWHWSHVRHHTDTIIVGRDREILSPRPPDVAGIFMGIFALRGYPTYFKSLLQHSFGKIAEDESLYIPESEFGRLFWTARVHLIIYLGVIALSVYSMSILPLLYIGLVNLYGSWLMMVYAYTQHAGLAEDVLDHRLNSRTVLMNRVNRYLYWNMNYHIEHHMYPLVPYHQLPRLHELIKDYCPKAYNGIIETYKEIIPTIKRQTREPGYYVRRKLPEGFERELADTQSHFKANVQQAVDGWIYVCSQEELERGEVIRFDTGKKTFAIYRSEKNEYYATDGMCTHGNTHLADGLVIGNLIECPKHNGRFDIRDGAPVRTPVCVGLSTYPVKVENSKIYLNIEQAGGKGITDVHTQHTLKVVSNKNVATFIKELVLEPTEAFDYQPGDYIQLDIPSYEKISFANLNVEEPFSQVWKTHAIYTLEASNKTDTRRNYSIASNPKKDHQLRFNVRLSLPPHGQDCSAGVGSSYVFNLKEGDVVTAIGPFGDFRIKESQKEMIYIGGGAGMAPLRSHLSYLLETQKTNRKISFWYGARSKQEIFYEAYFKELETQFDNFSFHIALSEAEKEDKWDSHTGFIHDIAYNEYLKHHDTPDTLEYYLCGPPAMIAATREMLTKNLGVSEDQILYDEF